jgi:hypothetical protein
MKFNKAILLGLSCWINTTSICSSVASPDILSEPEPEPYQAFVFMADGKPATDIPVFKLCPMLKPIKAESSKGLSFRVAQGEFLIGGVRQGHIQISGKTAPTLPPISAQNNKGLGLIVIDGAGSCVIGILNTKRKALQLQKLSMKSSRLAKLFEGDSWFGSIPNKELSFEESNAEELEIKKKDTMRNQALEKERKAKRKRVALLAPRHSAQIANC